jgi:hypothetical protein
VDPDTVLEILLCSASDSGSNQCLQRGSCYILPPSWRNFSVTVRIMTYVQYVERMPMLSRVYTNCEYSQRRGGCGWARGGGGVRVHVFKAWEGRGRGVASEPVVINNFR